MSVTVITMANAEQKSIGRIVKKLVMKSEPTIESTIVVSPLPELKYWSSEGSQTTAVSSAEIAEPTSISRQTRLQNSWLCAPRIYTTVNSSMKITTI